MVGGGKKQWYAQQGIWGEQRTDTTAATTDALRVNSGCLQPPSLATQIAGRVNPKVNALQVSQGFTDLRVSACTH